MLTISLLVRVIIALRARSLILACTLSYDGCVVYARAPSVSPGTDGCSELPEPRSKVLSTN